MTDFLTKEEKKISNEFEKKGYLIRNIIDTESLAKIRKIFIKAIKKNIKIKSNSIKFGVAWSKCWIICKTYKIYIYFLLVNI